MSEKKVTIATAEQAVVVALKDVSIAEKMRRLEALGTERGDIARLLCVRYQWVRNVLEREKEKRAKVK